LQREVRAIVTQTRTRSGWPVVRTLRVLGVSPRSYYRWTKEQRWEKEASPQPVQPYEVLAGEREAVLNYARAHPELRHRELAWRMVDDGIACVSASTVYRILKEARLVCPHSRRRKRYRDVPEKPQRPNERWVTDLLRVVIGEGVYYLLCFMDEYSRYVVYHELLSSMDSRTVSLSALRAIEGLRTDTPVSPTIQSDNGGCYIGREFRQVLDEHNLLHHRIRPHCPEENGTMERAYRTFRENLESRELLDPNQARGELAQMIEWYNEIRLHSAIGYLPPAEWYRGDPQARMAERRTKMILARERRRCANLGLDQPKLV
jgi:putative transposase